MEDWKVREENVVAFERVAAGPADRARRGGTLLSLTPSHTLVLRVQDPGTLCPDRHDALP